MIAILQLNCQLVVRAGLVLVGFESETETESEMTPVERPHTAESWHVTS